MTALPFFLYARVSKDDMHCENQRKILEDWAHRQGIENTIYVYDEISSRKTRPEKDKVFRAIISGQAEGVAVVRIDRWARSLQELVMDVQQMTKMGRFCAINNGFDFLRTPTASQMLVLQIFGAFAEFEREIIRERTNEGIARARAQGKHIGRPRKTLPPKPDAPATPEPVSDQKPFGFSADEPTPETVPTA